MINVPVGPVLEHIARLKLPDTELAARTGIPIRTFQELRTVRQRVRPETAAKIMALKIEHETSIDPSNRVVCTCGYVSQRFATSGLAKARKRRHETESDR